MRHRKFRWVETYVAGWSRTMLDHTFRKKHNRLEFVFSDAEVQIEVDEEERKYDALMFTSGTVHCKKCSKVYKQASFKSNHKMTCTGPQSLESIIDRAAAYAHDMVSTEHW